MTLETIYPPEVQAVQKALRDLIRKTVENYLNSEEGEAKIRKALGSFVEREGIEGIEVIACPFHCQERDKGGGEGSND